MTQTIEGRETGDAWARAVIFLLTLILTSSELHLVTYRYLHWVATGVAAILLVPYACREFILSSSAMREPAAGKLRKIVPACIPALLFLLAIYIPSIYGADPVPMAAGLGKLAVILLIGLPILAARERLVLAMFYGMLTAVWINAILLLGGILIGGPLTGMMAPGRWGTVLSYPGALWRIAITAWMYAAYLMFQRFSVKLLGLFLASTLLVYLDGARTSMMMLGLGVLCLVVILGVEAGHLCLTFIAVQIVAVILFAGSTILGVGPSLQQGALARMTGTLSSVANLGMDGLGQADTSRTDMLHDVVHAIEAHPVWGTGILSTRTETPTGPTVVHITYLQVWADLGLLGFLAYPWLVWGWLPWLPLALRRIRAMSDDRDRALYYNAVFLLFVFGLAGFFHPLTTEWAQWIPFLVPYALVWHLVRLQQRIPNV
jgi:hypothetical protein